MKYFLFLVFPFFGFAQTADKVVANYIQASGGIDKWSKIISCREQADVWQNLSYNNLKPGIYSTIDTLEATRHSSIRKLPNFEFERMTLPDGSTTTLFQNDKKSGMLTVGLFFDNPSPNNYTVIAMPQNILTLKDNDLLEYAGELEIDNKQCYVLSGPYNLQAKHMVKFCFDKKSNLLVAIINDKDGINRITYFKDYEERQGLKISLRQESYKDSILYFRHLTREIEFNPTIDNSVFYYKKKEETTNKTKSKTVVSKPDFKDGDLHSFIKDNYSGSRVFIDLWATWCAPCKIEFKKYDSSFYNTLSNLNTKIAFVSIDKKEKKKAWESEIEVLSIMGDHFLAGPLLFKSIKELVYKNNAVVIPRYILIDESGTILSVDFKRPSDPLFKKEIEKAFNR